MNPNEIPNINISQSERMILQQARNIEQRLQRQQQQLSQLSQRMDTTQNENVIPQQRVIRVNGKASVDAIRMQPDSEVILMDTTAPIVWLCTSDGVGSVTSTPYDISPHAEKPPVDLENLMERIVNLETVLTKLLGGMNDGKQSDDGAVERHENDETVK